MALAKWLHSLRGCVLPLTVALGPLPKGGVGKHLTVHPRLAQGPRGARGAAVWGPECLVLLPEAGFRPHCTLGGHRSSSMALGEAARVTLPLMAEGASVLGGQVRGAPRAPGRTAPSWLGLNE